MFPLFPGTAIRFCFFLHLNLGLGTSKIAQWIKTLATKPDNWSSIPGPTLWKNRISQIVLWPTHTFHAIHTHTHMHTHTRTLKYTLNKELFFYSI